MHQTVVYCLPYVMSQKKKHFRNIFLQHCIGWIGTMARHFRLIILLLIVTTAGALGSSSPRDTPNVKCKLEPVDDPVSGGVDENYIAVCRGLDLTRVPDNLPNGTVELYLDQNCIEVVPSFAFSYMEKLRVLDLSMSNVTTLLTNCFSGLNRLEELYLPFNNIVTASHVAPGVFLPLSQLRVLHVQGIGNGNYTTWSKEIERLDSLEELGISYSEDVVFPSELAALPHLTDLQLSYGPSKKVTSWSLNTLRRGKIQNLSFKANKDLAYIERGSFDDMPALRLLNFACCYNLALDHIIDVLSNISNTQVTHLIVDSTNRDDGDAIYGKRDVRECRSVWRHLTHLSMQECGLRFIHAEALRCFRNLTSWSYGYSQVPLPYPFKEGMEVLNDILDHDVTKSSLQSLRSSYLLRIATLRYRTDWGYFGTYRRRQHTDYFPSLIESEPDSGIFHRGTFTTEELNKGETTDDTGENQIKQFNGVQCKNFPLPSNLQHIEIDNIGIPGPGPNSYFCSRVSTNNLRFLNLSDNAALGPDINGVIYGLNQLRVVDVSRSRYRKLNPLLLENLPSLTHLYASGNSLRQDSFTSIGKARKLQHLDISNNAMSGFSRGAFLGLGELRTINLSKNRLNSTDFLIDPIPFLSSIDVSGNQLRSLDKPLRDGIDVRCSKTDVECDLEINLLDNPLSCECQDLPFIKWIRTTQANLTKRELLKCTTQDGQIQTIKSIDISGMDNYCSVITHLPMIASISATVAIVVLVVAPLVYHFRWHLKWYLYRLKYLRRTHRYTVRAEAHIRDAFVIYAFENTDDRRWVIETLRIKLEQENNYSLWLEGRNDIPGRFRVDSLMDMLRRSHTAIWILSQAFLQDIMCLEMAHQAFVRLGHKKNLVVRRPEVAEGIDAELATQDMGQILEVLHPTYGIRVAEYAPENRHSETLFWKKIERFLDKSVSSAHQVEMMLLNPDGDEPEGTLYE